jgi:hypothetical protein
MERLDMICIIATGSLTRRTRRAANINGGRAPMQNARLENEEVYIFRAPRSRKSLGIIYIWIMMFPMSRMRMPLKIPLIIWWSGRKLGVSALCGGG